MGTAQTWVGAPVPDGSDFQALLSAARVGAEWAWTAVYREYSPAVLRYLRGRGAHEPEDLLGDVFLQLVRNLAGFDGTEREFRTWVFMVAHNRLVDEWRRAGRSRVDFVPDDSLVEAGGKGDPEDDAMRSMADDRTMAVLRRLTPDQRDVLFLRLFARLTVEEVAAVVGKRPGAVKALQSRALAAIRREMSRRPVSF
jgi:RNA polymerase sigma factor (sigma-70 family)